MSRDLSLGGGGFSPFGEGNNNMPLQRSLDCLLNPVRHTAAFDVGDISQLRSAFLRHAESNLNVFCHAFTHTMFDNGIRLP